MRAIHTAVDRGPEVQGRVDGDTSPSLSRNEFSSPWSLSTVLHEYVLMRKLVQNGIITISRKSVLRRPVLREMKYASGNPSSRQPTVLPKTMMAVRQKAFQ